MPISPTKLQLIKDFPAIKSILATLQAKFPNNTPTDRIYAYYDPSYRVWHVCCTNYWTWNSKQYKLWNKIMRKKFKTNVIVIFPLRHYVSSDGDQRNGKNKDFYFFE